MAKLIRFGIIKAEQKKLTAHKFETYQEALEYAGLKSGSVDSGSLGRYHGIFVYEFGLFKPVAESHYYSINGHLYEGNAVLYQTDEEGETVDLETVPKITYYDHVAQVEAAIAKGDVARPYMAVNGKVIWQWPDPSNPITGKEGR